MLELVDGYAGQAHIGSDDLAVFNEATLGTTQGVFLWGNCFKCTMESANKATISTGAGLVEGRRFYESSATTLTIDSGSQGLKRYDLVVAEYKKDRSSQIETVELSVIKGKAQATPEDPQAPRGALVLWRIVIDGISAKDPVPLYKLIPNTSGQTFDTADNKGFRFFVRGNTATLTAYSVQVGEGSWDKTYSDIVIPQRYLPKTDRGEAIVLVAPAYSNNGAMSSYMWLDEWGKVSLGNGGGATWAEKHWATISWAVPQ